jgi:hypothetical protein
MKRKPIIWGIILIQLFVLFLIFNCNASPNINQTGENEFTNLSEEGFNNFDYFDFNNFSTQIQLVENYTIKGFIRDNQTLEPIKDAKIIILWQDGINLYSSSYHISNTSSNDAGYYEIKINISQIYLIVNKEKYYSKLVVINYNQSSEIWQNFSLDYGRPTESSIINGYISDNSSGEKISDALILNFWSDGISNNNISLNFTHSDESGYYSIHSSSGFTRITAYKEGYFDENRFLLVTQLIIIRVNILIMLVFD